MTLFLQTLVSGIGIAILLVMISVGLTMMFGVLGVVNFAQGEFMALAAYIGLAVTVGLGVSTVGSLAFMVPAIVALGVVFYLGVLRPTERHGDESRLLATFGFAFLLQGLVGLIWGVNPKAASQDTGTFEVAGVIITEDLVRNGLVAAVSVLLLAFFLYRTAIGREIRATADNAIGAELSGIDTGRVRLVAVMVASAMTAIGGLMLFTTMQLYPQVGFSLVLSAFAVVILGGLGSVGGSIVASFTLGLATAFVSTYIDASYANLVAFAVIIVVLLVRPQGMAAAR